MPNEVNKILEHERVKKSLKVSFMIPAGLECFLEKIILVKIILKNLIKRKKLSILLQVTHGLHAVHLMHQKINLVIIEKKTVWKSFVKT